MLKQKKLKIFHIKLLLTVNLLLGVYVIAAAQTASPTTGLVAVNKFKQFYNQNQPDSLFGMLSSKAQVILTRQKTIFLFTQLKPIGKLEKVISITSEGQDFNFRGQFENSTLTITLSLNGNNQIERIFFSKYEPNRELSDSVYTEFPINVMSRGFIISGTISTPRSLYSKIPIVLIVSGSGPTDRNGNSNSINLTPYTYRLLADHLVEKGIATLRYDKRGVGKSVANLNETDLHFDDYVNDVVELIKMLKKDERFSKVIVLGHSEGALIGMSAINRETADAFISVAGPGRPLYDMLLQQITRDSKNSYEPFRQILDSLRAGRLQKDIPAPFYGVMRPTIQPYLISLLKQDPIAEIKKIIIPTLILQGDVDLQVNQSDAYNLKKARPKSSLIIVKGMNHVLKASGKEMKDNIATYNDPDLPLHPKISPAICKFIFALK